MVFLHLLMESADESGSLIYMALDIDGEGIAVRLSRVLLYR
jgi:hypothetical protein